MFGVKNYISTTDYYNFIIQQCQRWKDIEKFLKSTQVFLTLDQADELKKIEDDLSNCTVKQQLFLIEFNRCNYYLFKKFDSIELPEILYY